MIQFVTGNNSPMLLDPTQVKAFAFDRQSTKLLLLLEDMIVEMEYRSEDENHILQLLRAKVFDSEVLSFSEDFEGRQIEQYVGVKNVVAFWYNSRKAFFRIRKGCSMSGNIVDMPTTPEDFMTLYSLIGRVHGLNAVSYEQFVNAFHLEFQDPPIDVSAPAEIKPNHTLDSEATQTTSECQEAQSEASAPEVSA